MFKLKDLHKNPILRHLIVGGVIVFILLLLVLFSDYGLINRVKYESQYHGLVEKAEDLAHKQDSLQNAEKQLKTDTLQMEKLAREKYGMIKKGETIYFIEDKSQ